MAATELHASVLLTESVRELRVAPAGIYLDATVGLGGHTEALLEASAPDGRVLGVDRDPAALELASGRLARFGDRVTLVEGSFSDVAVYAQASDHFPLDGAIADLGVSSIQLDDPGRGFSFRAAGPLDMRMGPGVGSTAAELIENFDRAELTRVLREYGEVGRPRPLAEAILEARDEGRLVTTDDLARVVERVEGRPRNMTIHPATKAFQAIRIAVNRELDELGGLLHALASLVRPGGRVAIISFHSLEDRIVKTVFADPPVAPETRHLPIERPVGPWRALTRRPIVPTEREVRANPRARSAKLRVAERREDDASAEGRA